MYSLICTLALALYIVQDATLKGVGYWTTVVDSKDTNHWLAGFTFESTVDQLVEQRLRVPAGSVDLTFSSQ
ncbi:hypothetical protein BH11CYA1_BH11CYA1_06900 [soil metagenome]